MYYRRGRIQENLDIHTRVSFRNFFKGGGGGGAHAYMKHQCLWRSGGHALSRKIKA